MTTPTPHELDAAINAFTKAEQSFADLTAKAEALLAARRQLDTTQVAMTELHLLLADAVKEEANVAAQLYRLTSSLNDAVAVVRRTDPKVVFESIGRLSDDFDLQRQRVSELAGELRARIDEAALKSSNRIDGYEKAMNERVDSLSDQVRKSTKATVFVGLVICALQFAILVGR